jgi:hypothetical protein
MNSMNIASPLRSLTSRLEWRLLVFLLLFLNVKVEIKVIAIVFIYLAQFDLRFGFKFRLSRLPLFYLLMIAIAFLNRLFQGQFLNLNQNMAFLVGLGFWAMCILAVHQMKLLVDGTSLSRIHFTILVFFVINAMVSFGTLLSIILETGVLNPYQYQGLYQKYFLGTGDNIRGISFDISTTNALLNAFGTIYFLKRNRALMTLLCMTVLLLTGSNFTNILITGTFIFIFLFQSNRAQKSLIALCGLILVFFMSAISPQNNEYVLTTFEKTFGFSVANRSPERVSQAFINLPDSMLTGEQRKQKIARLYLDSVHREIQIKIFAEIEKARLSGKPVDLELLRPKFVIPKPDINTAPFQRKDVVDAKRQHLLDSAYRNVEDSGRFRMGLDLEKVSGKRVALLQTFHFLKMHPSKIITGDGVGQFSSKLAYRTTALGIGGSYPVRLSYIGHDFKGNHLPLYLYYFSAEAGKHSITNTPNSVYDQLLSEYGIAGILAFLFFYLGYFTRRRSVLIYSIPFFIILGGAFLVDYWFEQLSVVIIFELILLVTMKESEPEHI